MRKLNFITIALIVCAISLQLEAQHDVNVMSYYAVGNSMDGRPMIDKQNILRFYPIYAMRDSVKYAKLTVYYGGDIYQRDMDKLDYGSYWETILPQFKLGEAIQRFEVETKISFDSSLVGIGLNILRKISAKESQLTKEFKKNKELRGSDPDKIYNQKLDTLYQLYDKQDSIYKKLIDDLGLTFDNLGSLLHVSDGKQKIIDQINSDCESAKQIIESSSFPKEKITILEYNSIFGQLEKFKILFHNETVDSALLSKIIENNWCDDRKKFIEKEIDDFISINSKLETKIERLNTKMDSISKANYNFRRLQDSLSNFENKKLEIADDIRNRILDELTDTTFSGISVRKSDIIIDPEFAYARILYRNYKLSLREMPALDPVESEGIFRIRYIPFPVTATKNNEKVRLFRPFDDNSTTVFEIGLSFGDRYIASDKIIIEPFSFNRFGFAFAITEELFSEDAQILALALTYDFNSYASLGVGANLAQQDVTPYFSFGINQRAFKAVMKSIVGIFN